MDDRVLALCELSNDLLFHKLPVGLLPQYVDESLAAGREAAQALAGRDILELYQENNIAIIEKGSGKGSYGIILRGQATLSERGCSVEVYRESIQSLADHSGGELTYDQALRAHLAHEFFHFLEFKQGCSVVDRLPQVVTLQFLGLKRRAKINRCAEVAAHAFAQALLGLPHLLNWYDYRYLIGTGAMTEADFDALTARMEQLLCGASEKKEEQE